MYILQALEFASDDLEGIHLHKMCWFMFWNMFKTKAKVKSNYLQEKHHLTLRLYNSKRKSMFLPVIISFSSLPKIEFNPNNPVIFTLLL